MRDDVAGHPSARRGAARAPAADGASPQGPRARRWGAAPAALALLLGLGLLPACAQGTYLGDRGHDLLDIVDLKGGRAMGLGVKAEATLYLGAGLGFAGLGDSVEWYGRDVVRVEASPDAPYSHGMFSHIVVVGFDVNTVHGGPPSKDSLNIIGINRVAFSDHEHPPMLDRWRFGGEVVLPFVTGGLYLNVGQVLDLVIGLTTLDIAGDDGVPGVEIEDPVDEEAGGPTGGQGAPQGSAATTRPAAVVSSRGR